MTWSLRVLQSPTACSLLGLNIDFSCAKTTPINASAALPMPRGWGERSSTSPEPVPPRHRPADCGCGGPALLVAAATRRGPSARPARPIGQVSRGTAIERARARHSLRRRCSWQGSRTSLARIFVFDRMSLCLNHRVCVVYVWDKSVSVSNSTLSRTYKVRFF